MSEQAEEKKYTPQEIGGEGCYALSYCEALLILRTPAKQRTAADAQFIREYAIAAKAVVKLRGERECENLKQRGMRRLLDMGIIEAKKNGLGELEPTMIHEDRVDRRSRLIVGNFQ